jgi:hypothetical protein
LAIDWSFLGRDCCYLPAACARPGDASACDEPERAEVPERVM